MKKVILTIHEIPLFVIVEEPRGVKDRDRSEDRERDFGLKRKGGGFKGFPPVISTKNQSYLILTFNLASSPLSSEMLRELLVMH